MHRTKQICLKLLGILEIASESTYHDGDDEDNEENKNDAGDDDDATGAATAHDNDNMADID